ncbi:hypothetical protein KCU95_g226, partial [Aureobasidium melanogenum]
MASLFRCALCWQSGDDRQFNSSNHIKSHLGSLTTHNLGPFACSQPGCDLRSNRADRNLVHTDANGVHNALWAEDLALKARIAAVVNASRYDPAEEEEEDDDEDDDGFAPEPRARRDEDLFADSTGDVANLTVKIDGIFIRETVFEAIFEVIDDEIGEIEPGEVTAELADLKFRFEEQREACVFAELIDLVKALAKASRLENSFRVLAVCHNEIKKTFLLRETW